MSLGGSLAAAVDWFDQTQGAAVDACNIAVPKALCEGAIDGYLSPFIVIAVFLMLAIERFAALRRGRPQAAVQMRFDLLGWFLGNIVLRGGAVVGTTLAVVAFHERVLGGAALGVLASGNVVVRVVLAVVIVDLLTWCAHWMQHRVPALWAFHAVHHSQTEMNVFTTVRLHFMEFVVTTPILVLPILLLGLDGEMVFVVPFALSIVNFFSHANVRTNYGLVGHVIVSPQFHRVHHSAESQHRDKNFALIFSFWDRLFGTAWLGRSDYPQTGVVDSGFPLEGAGRSMLATFWQQQIYPFRTLRRSGSSQAGTDRSLVSSPR